ncbi:hypothetical protein RUM43_001963 [Polyplax serrata]|uniref:Uncharacterized protein n=1 Tax=Polyplax serrata TaxID=468196 RepID=A0AAN8PFC6_POLSC
MWLIPQSCGLQREICRLQLIQSNEAETEDGINHCFELKVVWFVSSPAAAKDKMAEKTKQKIPMVDNLTCRSGWMAHLKSSLK